MRLNGNNIWRTRSKVDIILTAGPAIIPRVPSVAGSNIQRRANLEDSRDCKRRNWTEGRLVRIQVKLTQYLSRMSDSIRLRKTTTPGAPVVPRSFMICRTREQSRTSNWIRRLKILLTARFSLYNSWILNDLTTLRPRIDQDYFVRWHNHRVDKKVISFFLIDINLWHNFFLWQECSFHLVGSVMFRYSFVGIRTLFFSDSLLDSFRLLQKRIPCKFVYG